MPLLKIIIIVALIRLLLATDRPFLCSGIYASIALFFGLVSGGNFFAVVLGTAISYGLASIYFWLLNRFDSGPLFWLILIVGIPIGLV